MKPLLLVILIFSFNLSAKEKQESVDYLELASLMLKDENLDRAELALSQVDMNDEKLDLQRYYIISALLKIKQNDNTRAIALIKEAKHIGPVDAVINVHLAQAAFALEDYQLSIEALHDAGDAIVKIPSIYHMRAQSHWNLDNHKMAIAVLDQAAKIFVDNKSFPRRKIFYYIQLGYNKQAAELGKIYLHRFQAELNDYVAIGNALYASGDSATAL